MPQFREHMLEHTEGLPKYVENGVETTAVDYKGAEWSYAINITLLHDASSDLIVQGEIPSTNAEVMLVERAGGHGKIGDFSGVSGYIGERFDPNADEGLPDLEDIFDPIEYALDEELREECNLTPDELDGINFLAGNWIDFRRTPQEYTRQGSMIRVVPVVGLCTVKPLIVPKKDEITSYRWSKLSEIKHATDLEPGYYPKTLPACLGALGLTEDQIASII